MSDPSEIPPSPPSESPKLPDSPASETHEQAAQRKGPLMRIICGIRNAFVGPPPVSLSTETSKRLQSRTEQVMLKLPPRKETNLVSADGMKKSGTRLQVDFLPLGKSGQFADMKQLEKLQGILMRMQGGEDIPQEDLKEMCEEGYRIRDFAQAPHALSSGEIEATRDAIENYAYWALRDESKMEKVFTVMLDFWEESAEDMRLQSNLFHAFVEDEVAPHIERIRETVEEKAEQTITLSPHLQNLLQVDAPDMLLFEFLYKFDIATGGVQEEIRGMDELEPVLSDMEELRKWARAEVDTTLPYPAELIAVWDRLGHQAYPYSSRTQPKNFDPNLGRTDMFWNYQRWAKAFA